MSRLLLIALLAFDLGALWQSLVDKATHDTSSRATSERGVKQFGKKQYGPAVQSFGKANSIAPSPTNAFNLGTAQIADGKREDGSATLTNALANPNAPQSLRENALYNRATSALDAKSYDYAIRDYAEALRLQPGDKQAKRNLELALMRKQQQQREQSSNGKQKNPQGQQPQNPQQQGQGGPQKQPQPKGDPTSDSLLRSVQQQEQEELSRLHRAKGERSHVGW